RQPKPPAEKPTRSMQNQDLTSKKAIGTAAGFVGLFGYVGRVVQGKGIGWIAHHYSWDHALHAVLACAVTAAVLLLFTWNFRPRV
ncbi:MAG: hypothetical protein AAB676_19695, partial [Verrucomicrobiota bacterium]